MSDAAAGRRLQSASIVGPGSRFADRAKPVLAQHRVDRLPGRRVEGREAASEDVATTLLVASAGHVTKTQFDLQPSSGKPGSEPGGRADAQRDLAGEHQSGRTEIEQPDWHRNVQGRDCRAFGGHAR